MLEPSTAREPLRRPWFSTTLGAVMVVGLLLLPFLPVGRGGELAQGWRFVGHFHPLVLHLPIGVFVLVLLQELGRIIMRRPSEERGIGFPLVFGTLSAIAAVIAGYLLWKSGADDYAGNELAERHMWGGIVFTVVAVLTCLIKAWSQRLGWRPLCYRLPLFLSVGLMGFASHDGGSMTHGSDFLTKHAPEPLRSLIGVDSEERVSSADPLVYEDVIEPIFERRCVQCHKAGKSKGKLRMDSFEMLVKGGSEGPAIKPGNAMDSNIVVRMSLPLDDEERMPPEGKPQVERDELEVIKWWINSGADANKRLGEIEVPVELQAVIAGLLEMPAVADDDPGGQKGQAGQDKPGPEVHAMVDAINRQFPGTVAFESQQSPYLTLSAVSLRDKLDDDQFETMAPLLPHVVSVDLSATNIGDRSVASLGGAVNLRMLRLSETAITDASLDVLATLPGLESLNLFGTKVTDEGVMRLASIKSLKRLYLWRTAVTGEALQKLRDSLPGCEVVLGLE